METKISKLDYFAGQALVAIASGQNGSISYKELSKKSYQLAKEMMKESEKNDRRN